MKKPKSRWHKIDRGYSAQDQTYIARHYGRFSGPAHGRKDYRWFQGALCNTKNFARGALANV